MKPHWLFVDNQPVHWNNPGKGTREDEIELICEVKSEKTYMCHSAKKMLKLHVYC